MDITWFAADDAALDEARAVNAMIEDVLAKAPPVHLVDPVVTRRQRADGTGAFPAPIRVDSAFDRTIPGPAGDVPVRVLVPDDPKGVYLHIHGGGWVLGEYDQNDLILQTMADRLGLAAVSVGYRLAPEHPYPAGPDDCEAAARWLVEHARAEFGTERLFLGGESAGAHLSALTLLRMRDRHDAAAAFSGANLVFGAFDLGMTPSQRSWGDRNLILSTPIIAWFYDCFLPDRTAEERRAPDVSPLWADLSGLPPALFTVGALDPLLDDSLFMAARWHAAGNEARTVVFPESIHGFHAFGTRLAAAAVSEQLAFLTGLLARD